MAILIACTLLLCTGLLVLYRRRTAQAAAGRRTGELEAQVRAQGESLLESEARIRGIIEHAPAAIALKSLEGRFLMVNPRMQALLGRPQAEILGRTLREFFPGEAAARVQEREERVLGLRQALELEEQWPATDGRPRDYLVHRFPLVDALGHCWGLGVISTDITERRRADLAILQDQKTESLALLAGGFGHDFNNLLGAMQANLELAKLDPAGQAVREQVAELEALVASAGQLVGQMLSYAGQAPFELMPLDLNQVVEELLHLLRSSLPRNTLIRYDPSPLLPFLEGDRSQLNQLIINLVVNAAEAVAERGGTITLRTGLEHLDGCYIGSVYGAQGMTPGPYVTLEVTDTGCGLTPDIRERMFDPFFTTKPDGRGLGLSAAQGIVRRHRGGIRAYGEPGQGSQFKVVLPASGIGPPVPEEPAETILEDFRGSGTVLVVDDDDRMRNAAVRLLNHLGFDTLQARDGLEALELVESRRDRIQLILMDLSMPRMGGEEAYRELRQRGILVPVILSSGFQETEALRRFRGQGLAGFLQKPYKHNVLVNMLRETLAPCPE